MTDAGKRIDGVSHEVALVLHPLTRVRQTAAAVERAEQALHRARLVHADTLIAAHKAGHSLAQIGQVLGITRGRVHQVIRWRGEQEQSRKKGAKD